MHQEGGSRASPSMLVMIERIPHLQTAAIFPFFGNCKGRFSSPVFESWQSVQCFLLSISQVRRRVEDSRQLLLTRGLPGKLQILLKVWRGRVERMPIDGHLRLTLVDGKE